MNRMLRMSNKFFIGFIALMIVGSAGFVAVKNSNRPAQGERPGVAHEDKGRKHVEEGGKLYGGAIPPTSGDHASPAPWQVYNQEVPDVNTVHNLEHGGIVISYRPDLPQEQVTKMKELFSKPYSRKNFSPIKAIVAPRAANESPIIMSSWTRNLKMESFDEEKMVQYYLRNVGKAPEGSAL